MLEHEKRESSERAKGHEKPRESHERASWGLRGRAQKERGRAGGCKRAESESGPNATSTAASRGQAQLACAQRARTVRALQVCMGKNAFLYLYIQYLLCKSIYVLHILYIVYIKQLVGYKRAR